MAEKRYYWLKLKEDFFDQKEIKKLRRIAGGATYTIIYLKMLLLSIKNGGKIVYEGVEDSFAEELSLDIDENAEDIAVVLAYLERHGLIEKGVSNEFLLPEAARAIGSESKSAERVRRFREKNQATTPALPPKTDAERQRAFRAKKACEGKQHIPYIEDHDNKKRYNGNYYIVMKRDQFRCSICNNTENLCVHHIDGYCETKLENNHENKLIVLCRSCHSNVHAGMEIPLDVLERIDYFHTGTVQSNECHVFRNGDVTDMKRLGNENVTLDIESRDRDKSKSSSLNLGSSSYIDREGEDETTTANARHVGGLDCASAAEAFRLWENNIGTISPILSEKIRDLVKEVGYAPYSKAVNKAVERGKCNFAYISATAKGIAAGNDYDNQPKKGGKSSKNDVVGAKNAVMAMLKGEST